MHRLILGLTTPTTLYYHIMGDKPHVIMIMSNPKYLICQLSPPLCRLNRRDQRLESVLMLWCGSCEPSYWCKYVHVNIKSANGQALSREAALPDYARGRPDTVVKLLRERHDRGSMMSIACQPGQEVGQFWVEKSDGTLRAMQLTAVLVGTCSGPYTAAFQQSLMREERCYQVDIPRGQCCCPDYISNLLPCKHMFCVFGHQPEWTFGHLPASLRDQPRLLIDMVVVGEAAPAAHEAGPPPSPPPPATSPPPGILKSIISELSEGSTASKPSRMR